MVGSGSTESIVPLSVIAALPRMQVRRNVNSAYARFRVHEPDVVLKPPIQRRYRPMITIADTEPASRCCVTMGS